MRILLTLLLLLLSQFVFISICCATPKIPMLQKVSFMVPFDFFKKRVGLAPQKSTEKTYNSETFQPQKEQLSHEGYSHESYSYETVLAEIQSKFSETVFYNLDYGLYWADEHHVFYSAQHELPDHVYNPTAPTVIYIHGWQRGATMERKRETLFNATWKNYAHEIDVIKTWRNQGYNVGVLYWNQFADESEVKDAEAKIWSNQGHKGMRWCDADGEYHMHDASENVVELLLTLYAHALRDYQGPKVRFVGHSLGSQVAISLAYQLYTRFETGEYPHFEQLLPKRIALLDPFFSRGSKNYLEGNTIGTHTSSLVRKLITENDMLFESYRSTWPVLCNFIGDVNTSLLQQTAHLEYYPDFVAISEVFTRHKICLWLYGLSFDKAPPCLVHSNKIGLSASTSDEVVKEWMNSSEFLIQIVHLENITQNKESLGKLCTGTEKSLTCVKY